MKVARAEIRSVPEQQTTSPFTNANSLIYSQFQVQSPSDQANHNIMFRFIVSPLVLIAAVAGQDIERDLGPFRKNGRELTITVQNIAYQQPMSPFFYMVHNRDNTPLFELGMDASQALRTLAEDGSSAGLSEMYDAGTNPNVLFSNVTDGSIGRGETSSFTVTINRNFPFISFASMAVNTNDCFVGINTMYLYPGMSLSVPGYDAGTEENNELCSSIPGPACDMASGNVQSGNPDGPVHIHRGIHGTGDLDASDTDWRNPMLLITVK